MVSYQMLKEVVGGQNAHISCPFLSVKKLQEPCSLSRAELRGEIVR